MKKYLYFVFISLIWSGTNYSQNSFKYDSKEASAVVNLITGKQYQPSYVAIKNGPFLVVDDQSSWFIDYLGVRYRKVDLKYDIYGQKVIIKQEAHSGPLVIELDHSKVSAFGYLARTFKWLEEEGDRPEGFYELIFSSPNQSLDLYALRSKTLKEKIDGLKQLLWFEGEDRFFLSNISGTHEIDDQEDLWSVFSNEAELRLLFKNESITFNQTTLEQDLLRAMNTIRSNSKSHE